MSKFCEPVAWRVLVGTTDRFGNRMQQMDYNEMGIGEPLFLHPKQEPDWDDPEVRCGGKDCNGKCCQPIIAWQYGYRSITTGEIEWEGISTIDPAEFRDPDMICRPLYASPCR